MTRSNAREIACHLVFEMNFNDITAGDALRTLMEEDYYPTLKGETDVYAEKPDGKQLEYLTNVVQGVQAKREELEGYITKYSVGWSLSRIARMAVGVLLFLKSLKSIDVLLRRSSVRLSVKRRKLLDNLSETACDLPLPPSDFSAFPPQLSPMRNARVNYSRLV